MKNILKKSLSVFLAITIIFSSALVGLNEIDFSGVFAVKVEALTNSEVTDKLTALKSEWPQDSYYTDSFGGGIQCYAFARYLGYRVFGSYPYNASAYGNGYTMDGWTLYKQGYVPSIEPGDIIQTSGHTAIVWYVSSNKIYVAECWGSYGCIVKWGGYFNGSSANATLEGICQNNTLWGVWKHTKTSTTVPPTGITASEKQFTMTVGENKTVTATVSPSNANNKNVTWTSSDTSVATVSNGVIKAVSSGGATIKATNSAGHEACIEVVVNPVNIIADGMVEHDGHTYEIFHSTMTWKQAKEYCEKQGGHLATITSKEENDAVLGLMEKYGNEKCEEYFIGMTDEDSAGTYTWITREEFTYENWDEGEPSNAFFVLAHERYQNYGAILKNGLWDDVNNYANVCAPVFGFICEYEKEFAYDNVTIIGDKVYELYEREYPITFANEFAENKGGNLATITSEKEQTALIAWIQANSDIKKIAIGASDAENESVWQWLNGEEWGYAPWDDGEPNDYSDGEDYAVLILGLGKWNDVPGANTYSFVIEYDLEEWLDAGNDANDIIFNELPEGADPDDYEIVTEYRYRDKETKTSPESGLDGWELYDSETTYGSWGSVQSTKTKPTESDTLQITGTWQQYHYYHYVNYYANGGNNWNVDSIAYGSSSERHDVYLGVQLPAYNFPDQGGKQAYGSKDLSPSYACDGCRAKWGSGYEFYTYFYGGETTFYNYQTRTKTTTNHFYKYGDWSAWNTTPVVATSNKQVETRTVYKLKDHKHTSSSWITDSSATVYKAGSKHKECTECGETLETATIPQIKCSAPVLKKVYNANSYVKVTWGTVKGADKYYVYRKTGTGDYEYIGSTTNTYFNDKEAGAGKTCRYIVKAKNEAGDSVASNSLAIKHIDEPTLKSIENSAYGVLIKWDKVTGAEKYNVYRKVSGGEYKYIGATSKTYYTDKTAKSGTKYYYAIRAKRDDSVSSQSASLSKYYLVDPTLKTPTSTTSGVKLTWSKVTGAEGYVIYRKIGSGSYSKLATVKGNSKVTYTDKSAKKGKKYYYKVKAYKSSTYSAYSNTKSITDKY